MLTVRTSLGVVVDTPLFQAALNGTVAVVKELLAKGAAPNQGIDFGEDYKCGMGLVVQISVKH